MAIADLTAALPAPPAPNEASSADWADVEARIGTALPADYKAFVEVYGSGRIGGFVWIFNPFSKRETINLLVQADRQREILRELAQGGEAMPFPLFPEPGGLLPFGMTDNGDVLHWRTRGSPEEWSIVVNDARSSECSEHAPDLTRFLASVVTRREQCDMFPASFPPQAPAFEPM